MLGIVFPHQLFRELPPTWTEVWFVRHDIGYGGKHTTVADFHVARKIFLRAAEKGWLEHIHASYGDTQRVKVRVLDRGAAWATKVACEVWDPVDQMLEAEIRRRCPQATFLDTPAFLLSKEEAAKTQGQGQGHAAFYAAMRKEFHVLLTAAGGPQGGKWRFDVENRARIPNTLRLPAWDLELKARESKYVAAAAKEILRDRQGIGEWTGTLVFPTTHEGAVRALHRFLQHRLAAFGPYQDAITAGEAPANAFHFHSVLSAAINVGLLTPDQVLVTTLGFAETHKVPLESVEGFVAQILGWREYMRAAYVRLPVPANRLGHRRRLSRAWYTGETGLLPVDTAIRRVTQHAYLHHIERLMIVGNAMFLCEVQPAEVYRWFMELFADSWDWVMVGNVYYMSQWASDALTTKPYISSSAYVLRMSDYQKGDWCADWDALYWNTVRRLKPLLRRNYRMAAQVSFWERKPAAEQREIQRRVLEVLNRM